MKLICFSVGTAVYGLDMGGVLKLAQLGEERIEELPNTDSHVVGAIEYEGHPICTYDICEYLGSPQSGSSKDVVIFLGADESSGLRCIAGIKVGDLRGVEHDVSEEEIRPVVGEQANGDRNYIKGLVKATQGEIIVIDIEKFVDSLQKERA